MMTLLILATIGAMAGGLGGALTNGLDGSVLGGCAGFVLGVVAWITDHMAEHRGQELQPEPLINEFPRTAPAGYEQPITYHPEPTEQVRSP